MLKADLLLDQTCRSLTNDDCALDDATVLAGLHEDRLTQALGLEEVLSGLSAFARGAFFAI